jgi:hypothetical protein
MGTYESNKRAIYKWRATHREEYLARGRRDYAKRKEQVKEMRKEARAANVDAARAYGRAAFQKHYALHKELERFRQILVADCV